MLVEKESKESYLPKKESGWSASQKLRKMTKGPLGFSRRRGCAVGSNPSHEFNFFSISYTIYINISDMVKRERRRKEEIRRRR